jgi:hypothetical protein
MDVLLMELPAHSSSSGSLTTNLQDQRLQHQTHMLALPLQMLLVMQLDLQDSHQQQQQQVTWEADSFASMYWPVNTCRQQVASANATMFLASTAAYVDVVRLFPASACMHMLAQQKQLQHNSKSEPKLPNIALCLHCQLHSQLVTALTH